MNYIARLVNSLTIELPDCPPELIDLYALLAFSHGTWTNMEDVHDAWAIWKNRLDADHMSLVPFDELSPEVRELARKYMEAIHKVARMHSHRV